MKSTNTTDKEWLDVERRNDGMYLLPRGTWSLSTIEPIRTALGHMDAAPSVISGERLEHIDTSGAMVLLDAAPNADFRLDSFRSEHRSIIELVRGAERGAPPPWVRDEMGFLGHIGHGTIELGIIIRDTVEFIGHTAVEAARTVLSPRRLRVKELVAQLEQVFVNAIPIVCLVTFLIGVVVAYLFGVQIQKYGANIYIVDAAGLAMCRELSPILVAIIVAGRSGSAFTAQIGTMKLNEEIDAMTTLGMSPMSVLVYPRVLALVLAMPLLVFVGDVVGILGSMMIADLRLGVTGVTFVERLHAVLPVKSVFVGFAKAPVFAMFIAVIGCQLGLTVENNARSVGLHTTSTVVRSIVAVILLNAAFAVIFQELHI